MVAPKKKKAKPNRSAESQARRAAAKRARHQEGTRFSQDIGFAFYDRIGRGPKDKDRREACRLSFRKFCEVYFPKLFCLEWSVYHLTAISKIEDAVLRGKMFALAMPRGSGKTALCRAAILWATLYGHSTYSLLVTATAASAKRRLNSLKKMLRNPPKRKRGEKAKDHPDLADDFPEIILAIRHLGNESGKAKGQKFFGELTDIEWDAEKFAFPSLDLDHWPEEKPKEITGRWITKKTVLKNWEGVQTGFGSIIDVASMEGEIRGRSHTRVDGTEARPDLAIVDDPQTKKSAKSKPMVESREETLSSDIAYLGGPDKPIGVVVPCTVIYEDDLADRILNHDLHPEYRGERTKMVNQFPDGWDLILAPPPPEESETIQLWRRYRKLQLQDFKDDGSRSLDLYTENERVMNDGWEVTWNARKGEYEKTAIQHAVNLFFKSPSAFYSEAQNEPQGFRQSSLHKKITVADLQGCTNGIARGIVPDDYDKLVGFVDISGTVLWWAVVAIRSSDFAIHVVDFGAWPDQRQNYYSLSNIRETLQLKYGEGNFEAVLKQALTDLTEHLADSDRWQNESGDDVYLNALGIDSGWGDYAVDVYKFCRRDLRKSILQATKGFGIKATNEAFVNAEKKPKKGTKESVSGQWKLSPTRIRTKLLSFDSNFSKSKVMGMFRLGAGPGQGGFSIFQAPPEDLQVFCEQQTAEVSQLVKAKREVEEFQEIPGRDNHFFDCVVGSIVTAHAKLHCRYPDILKNYDPDKTAKAEARKEEAEVEATEGRSFGRAKRKRSRRRKLEATF